MKRPWGSLHQLFDRLQNASKWDLVGAVSFEDRCSGALETLYRTEKLGRKLFFKINDPISAYSEIALQKTQKNFLEFTHFGVSVQDVFDIDLMAPANVANAAIQKLLVDKPENIILDISCLPKRLFFVCLKLILANPNVKNLIVTYAIPTGYTEDLLASDTLPLGTLPTFGTSEARPEDPRVIIIGVGYLPFDLAGFRQQLTAGVPEKVLFPFPPGPPSFQRNWKFLLDIFGEAKSQSIPEPIRVDARDASYAFDLIEDITNQGSIGAYLLPFGPKPHSLAMALHYLKSESKDQILYTQPQAYHYDYSIGIRRVNSFPEVYGYCIKLAGINLYK